MPQEDIFTLEVLNGYRGHMTQEEFIEPGLYMSDDERLFGLAEYLIKHGHARRAKGPRIRSVAPIDAPVLVDGDEEADDQTASSDDLDDMTRPQLLALVKEHNIDVPKNAKTQVIIEAIRKSGLVIADIAETT